MKKESFEKVDGRTKPYRRWHTLFSEFLAHTGTLQGRHNIIDRAAAKRAASLTLLLEKYDAQIIRGEQVNGEAYSRISSALERVLTQLGILEPEPEPKKQTLKDLLDKKEQLPHEQP